LKYARCRYPELIEKGDHHDRDGYTHDRAHFQWRHAFGFASVCQVISRDGSPLSPKLYVREQLLCNLFV
jgi:hypothetical protein